MELSTPRAKDIYCSWLRQIGSLSGKFICFTASRGSDVFYALDSDLAEITLGQRKEMATIGAGMAIL
jgi:hypothetical protein